MYRKKSDNFELRGEKSELPNGKHTSDNDININMNGKYEKKGEKDTQPGKTEEKKYVSITKTCPCNIKIFFFQL